MPTTDLQRACTSIAEEYLSVFRVVILNGPRQSGKTTLLRHLQERYGGTLLNLDDEQTLQAAISDPVAFRATGNRGRGVAGLGHAPRRVVVGRHPTPG